MSVKISNFKLLVAQNRAVLQSSQQFSVADDGFFIFQRKIISDIYDGFSGHGDEFRIYLYMCRHVDKHFRKCIKSKEAMNIELEYSQLPAGQSKLPIYSKKVDDALEWLETNDFIQNTNTKLRQPYQAKILVAPDYHPLKKRYYSCDDIKYSSIGLKDSNSGYIMVPNDAVQNDMLKNKPGARQKWTLRRLKTMLLLHGFCWLEYFGGIDPNIVEIDELNETLALDAGFCYNLKGTVDDISKNVISLMNEGLFVPVRCMFVDNVYYGDVGYCSPPANKHVQEKIVLRPKHLVRKSVHKVTMQMKWGNMIP